MSALPTGTVTFLFTDIEGSTRLKEMYPEAMRKALSRHNVLIRDAIIAENGVVFSTGGDSFCAAFAAATDAVNAALVAQCALMPSEVVPGASLRVRMALHTGEAQPSDGDYTELVLNRVARLLAIAHGGQILLSHATQQLTRDSLPPESALRDLGEHRLKDLQRSEQVFGLLHPLLPSEFPPLRSPRRQPNNLSPPQTSFIGRDKELAQVKMLLEKTRLLTVMGSGGCGKTRLCLQAAADMLESNPDGVWLVELASISDPILVPQALANVLNIKEQPGLTLSQTLTDWLKSKRLLLVLDNCEHLLSACVALVGDVFRHCPDVRLLASSREGLNVAGEQTYRVPSLSLPDPKKTPTAASIAQCEAVRLFVERAVLVRPEFAVTNANAPAVASVCRRVDGIPLALELAAVRVRSLSVEEINDRLDNRFRLLTGGSRSALPRQQTLRAMIDWSYDLLIDAEKLLLCRLSVFNGGWTLDAAEAVCSGGNIDEWEVLDLLASLVDKSLVNAEEEDGQTRYRLLETVRQYAWERLPAISDPQLLRERHRDYFLAFAERVEPELEGPQQTLWLDRLEAENDNLRAVLLWAGDTERRLGLAAALYRFWYVRGYWSEGRVWLEEGATSSAVLSDPLRAKAFNRAGIMAWAQGDYPAAQNLYERGLALFQKLEDKKGTASTLHNLGIVATEQKNYDLAQSYYEQSLVTWRELDNKPSIARILSSLGGLLNDAGDPSAARPLLEESLAFQKELGNTQGIATVLYNLAEATYKQGNFAAALHLYQQRLALEQELKRPQGIFLSLRGVAMMAGAVGDYQKSVFLLSAAEKLRRSADPPIKTGDLLEYEKAVARAKEELREEEYRAEWQGGMDASYEQVMIIALQ